MIDLDEIDCEHRLRNFTDLDEGFVIISWVAELARSPTFQQVDISTISELLKPQIRAFIRNRQDLIKIICPKNSNEPIEGFIIYDKPILYALHIKGPFRKLGLMTWALNKYNVKCGDTITVATDTKNLHNIHRYDIRLNTNLLFDITTSLLNRYIK